MNSCEYSPTLTHRLYRFRSTRFLVDVSDRKVTLIFYCSVEFGQDGIEASAIFEGLTEKRHGLDGDADERSRTL